MLEAECAVSCSYSEAVERPYALLARIGRVFPYKRRPFVPVIERMGWWSPEEDVPVVSEADAALLEEFQCELSI